MFDILDKYPDNLRKLPVTMHSLRLKPATFFILCCLLLLSTTLSVQAATSAPKSVQKDYSKQRALFLKAEYAARQSKSRDYARLYKKLDGYPLQPYIELAYLKKHTYLSNREQIKAFLSQYVHTPMAWPLRKKWLHYLAKKNKQAWFLEDYRPTSDKKLQCYHLRYQLAADGPSTTLFERVDELWISKKSMPKACDPLFKAWQQAGQRTPEKIWQRLTLVATKGSHTLIPYLKRISPEKDQYMADLWHKTRRRPHTVSRLKQFPNKDAREREILLYGVKRLIWKDRKLALRSWAKMQQKFEFTSAEKAGVIERFAIRLAKAGDSKAQQWLDKIPSADLTNDLVQWRIADSLRHGQWDEALAVLQSLPPELADKEGWTYWLGRALEQTGAKQDANKAYLKVAIERHYYGFLASTILGQQPNLADRPLVFTDAELGAVDKAAGAQRALEFRQLERFSQSRREWHSLNDNLTRWEKLAAAKWANLQGWYSRAIFTLPQQNYWDDVDLRFPLAYQKLFSHHATRNKIDASLAFAIARRESSFMADAYSPVGALGLMQLMPNTAKFIAKKKVSRSKLFTANTNIRYGTDYLKYMLKTAKGNELIAAASYNAGYSRVKKWVKKSKGLPADIWIETIPFKETRDYVKSVLAYRQIYSTRLGNPENTFKRLTTMVIGK
ncbi:MAG: soluble lytic murein transglycosylase [Phenylobacterium sp.]|jgi:soluble lytic murein transglycosylase